MRVLCNTPASAHIMSHSTFFVLAHLLWFPAHKPHVCKGVMHNKACWLDFTLLTATLCIGIVCLRGPHLCLLAPQLSSSLLACILFVSLSHVLVYVWLHLLFWQLKSHPKSGNRFYVLAMYIAMTIQTKAGQAFERLGLCLSPL